MNKKIIAVCAAALTSILPSASHALTFQTADMLQTQLAATRFDGVGKLVFQRGGGRLDPSCTASLVSANVILTAAHCLSASVDHRFVLDSSGKVGSYQMIFSLKNALAIPSSSGAGVSDMALITLDRNVYGRQIYDLYTATDEMGQAITMVGAGYSGLLSEGANRSSSDFKNRYGFNRYEAGATMFGYNTDILMLDYDNGLEKNDVFGKYLGINDTGIIVNGKLADAGLIYGDSGGPDFIGNKLAGVHSFSASGSFFEPTQGNGCGLPGSVDSVPKGPLDTCTDGSFGDFGGSVRVSFYQSQIRSYIAAAAVPEPTTWSIMIAGFMLVGGAIRYRKPVLVAART